MMSGSWLPKEDALKLSCHPQDLDMPMSPVSAVLSCICSAGSQGFQFTCRQTADAEEAQLQA